MCFRVVLSVPFSKQKFNLFFNIIEYITKVLENGQVVTIDQ